jgi:ATP adenylyltransferase/5',5'''-P-1,P-4-tetraphosphate phosphorylase II
LKFKITKKDRAQKILREVPQRNAFYFFNGINNYTGDHARSLVVLLNKLKTIDKESMDFHFKRRDFENWIRSTIGDDYLANEIAKITEYIDEEELLEQIYQTIEKRLRELKQFLANEEPYVEHDDDL